MKQMKEDYPSTSITVVRWSLNKEAPFKFNFSGLTVREKSEFDKHSLLQFVQELQPDMIVSSGWMDSDYMAVCKRFKKKIPVILTLDNHWTGNIKQRLAQLAA